jgi:hypothetical protein
VEPVARMTVTRVFQGGHGVPSVAEVSGDVSQANRQGTASPATGSTTARSTPVKRRLLTVSEASVTSGARAGTIAATA